MGRHQGLEADRIRRLTADAESVNKTDKAISRLVSSLLAEIDRHFRQGKRIPAGRLFSMFAYFDGFILDKMNPIDARYREIQPTRARPNGGEIEGSYVCVKKTRHPVAGLDDLYQLFTLRLYMTRKYATIDIVELPAVFQYHAAERFMERTDGLQPAFHEIAQNLADWYFVIQHARDVVGEATGGNLAIPAIDGGGTLLGKFESIAGRVGIQHRFDRNGAQSFPIVVPGAAEPFFVAKTFMDWRFLRPVQSYAMNLLSQWRADNADEFMATRDDLLWPFTFRSAQEAPPAFGESCGDDLHDILLDPCVVRAMHRDREAYPTRPEDYDLPLGPWDPTLPPEPEEDSTGYELEGEPDESLETSSSYGM